MLSTASARQVMTSDSISGTDMNTACEAPQTPIITTKTEIPDKPIILTASLSSNGKDIHEGNLSGDLSNGSSNDEEPDTKHGDINHPSLDKLTDTMSSSGQVDITNSSQALKRKFEDFELDYDHYTEVKLRACCIHEKDAGVMYIWDWDEESWLEPRAECWYDYEEFLNNGLLGQDLTISVKFSEALGDSISVQVMRLSFVKTAWICKKRERSKSDGMEHYQRLEISARDATLLIQGRRVTTKLWYGSTDSF